MTLIRQIVIALLTLIIILMVVWGLAYHQGYCEDEANQAHAAVALHTQFIIDVQCITAGTK